MEDDEWRAIVERANRRSWEYVEEASKIRRAAGQSNEDRAAVMESALGLAALSVAYLEIHGPDDPEDLRRIIARNARENQTE